MKTIFFDQTGRLRNGGWILIFVGVIASLAFAYRPLGAVVGDFLDKPIAKGGLDLSRYSASVTLLVLIAILILVFPHRAAKRSH